MTLASWGRSSIVAAVSRLRTWWGSMKVRTYLELQDIKAGLAGVDAKVEAMASALGSKLDALAAAISMLNSALGGVSVNVTNLGKAMADLQAEVDAIKADLDTVKQQTGDYIAARDQIDADLKAQIANLIAQHQADAAAKAALQTSVDAAFASAEALKGNLQPPAVTASLATSFPDNASFTAAVQAYQNDGGPRTVTLDGNAVFTGTTPSLDYFTHSDQSGAIDMTGPTS